MAAYIWGIPAGGGEFYFSGVAACGKNMSKKSRCKMQGAVFYIRIGYVFDDIQCCLFSEYQERP